MAQWLKNKWLKFLLIFLGVIFTIGIGFHYWIIYRATTVISEFVSSKSDGKLELSIDKIRFNWLKRSIVLKNNTIHNNDSTAIVTYEANIKELYIGLSEILPLIVQQRLLIDSIHVHTPVISVLKKDQKIHTVTPDSTLSVSQEMGLIYNNIQHTLKELNVRKFNFVNGSFHLINENQAGRNDMLISNIDIHIDKLKIDDNNSQKENILFSENVSITTHNQQLQFLDGRHALSFKNFNFNIKDQLVEFDSCTISAFSNIREEDNFSIFFDKLRLGNVDFSAVYNNDIIKADTVYCLNPKIFFQASVQSNKTNNKDLPKIDSIIQHLAGDLDLGFVIFENASFFIDILRDNKPNTFQSHNNSFFLKGLKINHAAAKPLVVDQFSMAIRNYEHFWKDSSFTIHFDSVLLADKRINLYDFSFEEFRQQKKWNKVAIPDLQLYNFSWDQLIFNQTVQASMAALYKPDIHYRIPASSGGNKDLFSTLANIGDVLELNEFTIKEGNITLYLPDNSSIHLSGTNLSVAANSLVDASGITGIQRSVHHLSFQTCMLKKDNNSVTIHQARYTPNEGLVAQKLNFFSGDRIAGIFNNVQLNNLLFNEAKKVSEFSALQWQQASIEISQLDNAKKAQDKNKLLFTNLSGKNTMLLYNDGTRLLKTQLDNIAADTISIGISGEVIFENFYTKGTKIEFKNPWLNFKSENFVYHDNRQFQFDNITAVYEQELQKINAHIPSLAGKLSLNNLIAGSYFADSLLVQSPAVTISSTKNSDDTKPPASFPVFNINKLMVLRPSFSYFLKDEFGETTVSLTDDAFNHLVFQNILSSPQQLQIDNVEYAIANAIFKLPEGKEVQLHPGRITGDMKDVIIRHNQEGSINWNTFMNRFTINNFTYSGFQQDSSRIHIDTAAIYNIRLNKEALLSFKNLITDNNRMRIQHFSGNYTSNNHNIKWYNAAYTQPTQKLTVDSFVYKPTPSPDSFLANKKFQTDYIYGQTGKIAIQNIDLKELVTDTIIQAGKISIDNAAVTDFRDKRLPFNEEAIKPFFTESFTHIPSNIAIDSIEITNGSIIYEELNPKNDLKGAIRFTHLEAMLTNVRNFRYTKDSLLVVASAQLMDSFPIQLVWQEDYTDSLRGFVMNVFGSGAAFQHFNPVLIPLAAAEIKSGKIDTLFLRAYGDNIYAYGNIDFLYSGLKINLLKPDTNPRKGLGRFFVNGIANTVVKNRNRNKTARFFFKRHQNRSVFNYWAMIAVKGISSTAIPFSKPSRKEKRLIDKKRKIPYIIFYE